MEVCVVDKKERERLVLECRASGMTAKAWCEEKGIKYRSYIDWATALNKESQQEEPQQWAKVANLKEEHSSSEIKLNCGKWTICVGAGFSPTLLSDVLRVVDGVC